MSKVFLSYSHKDQEFVTDLYKRLKRDGVECFFDKESIQWGDNWVEKLEEGLKECDFIVFILTPNFCQSMWSQNERTAVMAAQRPGMKERIKPLLLKECGDQLPLFFQAINYINITSTQLFAKNYPDICRNLGGNPPRVGELVAVDRTKLPPLRPLPRKHRMPYRSLGNAFAGRIADLWKIHDGLVQRGTAVIQGVGLVVGMGGIGKTQLAVEYARRFGYRYGGGVFWVDAEAGRLTMIAQIAHAAGIDIQRQEDEQDQLNMLWHGLGSERVLMVLDNFPEGEEIEKWLPTEQSIFTLVTSRRKDFFKYLTHDLEKLHPDEALDILNSGKRKLAAEEAAPLIDSLEGMPLALELAKHFLNLRPELSIKELMQEMETLGEMEVLNLFTEKYRNQLPTHHSKQVAATFGMGWDLASEFEQKVLIAIAYLAPAPVPRRLLKKILDTDTDSQSKLTDPLGEAISRLHTGLSLLELDQDNDPRMHRLIAVFVRTVLDDKESLQKNVISAVRNEMARVTDDHDTSSFQHLEKVLPHGDYVLLAENIEAGQAVDIVNYMGWHHWKWGRYLLGERYRREALRIAEAHYPIGDPKIATQQSNLALVLQDLGDLKESRDLLRAALASAKKSFSPGHPTIAIRQSNLALVLQDLGDLDESRDLLRSALASDQNSFSPGHPSISRSQSNLAMVLRALGDLEESRDLLSVALGAAEKSFSPGHPSIAKRQSNLALVLADLGDLEESRDLLHAALASAEKSFSPGHPTIAIGQSNLALVLQDLGNLEESRDLLRAALWSDQKSFSPGHPTIAKRQSNLALVLQELGDLDESRNLLRAALGSAEKSFSSGHPSIAKRQSNLALVLQDLGDLDESRDLLRAALGSAEKSFSPGHPSIAIRQSNLALVLADLGDLDESRDLLRAALRSDQKSFSPGHPTIASSQSNLALVLQDLGDLDESRDLLRIVLGLAEKSFLPGHPTIAKRQSNLALVLADLRELKEAKELLTQAYHSFREKLGADHPSSKTVKGNLEFVKETISKEIKK
jgi:tetratricopeptide (TPR) repeat protein